MTFLCQGGKKGNPLIHLSLEDWRERKQKAAPSGPALPWIALDHWEAVIVTQRLNHK